MAKRKSDTQLPITPLKGVVRILGEPPEVAAKDLGARVADLIIALTGGTARFPATVTFAVVLNTAAAARGTAELIDEATTSRSTPATRNAKGYTFTNVKFAEPGQAAARVFRITNVRANVSGLGIGTMPGATPITASIAIAGSTSTPLRLSGGRQVVALASSKTITKQKRAARRGDGSNV